MMESKSISNLAQIIMFFIVFMCLFQSILNYLRRNSKTFKSLPGHLQPATVVRIISSIHAILSALSALAILLTDSELAQNKLLYSSFAISLTLNMSMGFLFYDCFIMFVYRDEFEWFYGLHHFVSIIAFYACSTAGVFPFIALLRLTSEGSTPFINNRWILLTLNMKSSKWYVYNGIATALMFFAVRIVTIVPNWLIFYACMNMPIWHSVHFVHKFICVFSSMPLDCLNVYWFSKIMAIVVKSIVPPKATAKSHQSPSTGTNIGPQPAAVKVE